MLLDLDRYYTPRDVAKEMLANNISYSPQICVDSTCGAGHLLEAADQVFEDTQCIGLDRDRNTIVSLRRKNPHWILSVADLLNSNSYKKTHAISKPNNCDLLIMNPPFSHGRQKSVDIEYLGKALKGSVAMAHILQSFQLFKPNQGAMVIVPESLLYSETDALARNVLGQQYKIEIIDELHSETFKGARARATIIKFTPGITLPASHKQFFKNKEALQTHVIRGGLQVHAMQEDVSGVPFIHSTNIKELTTDKSLAGFFRTTNKTNGRVTGWNILLPRVGIPDKTALKAVYFNTEVQLSDCVIALNCKNKTYAQNIAKRLNQHWDGIINLYRGTGARYITISRLREWLSTINISNV